MEQDGQNKNNILWRPVGCRGSCNSHSRHTREPQDFNHTSTVLKTKPDHRKLMIHTWSTSPTRDAGFRFCLTELLSNFFYILIWKCFKAVNRLCKLFSVLSGGWWILRSCSYCQSILSWHGLLTYCVWMETVTFQLLRECNFSKKKTDFIGGKRSEDSSVLTVYGFQKAKLDQLLSLYLY